MSASDVEQYVVTFRYQEGGLSDLFELNSTLTGGGFTTSLHSKDGHPHELGTNSFGFISALDKEQIRELAVRLGEIALGEKPEVDVKTREEFLAEKKPGIL